MPCDGLFSAHYSNEASMVSDIYIIYIPPNILMNTEFFFFVVVVVSIKGASTHHLQGSFNNATLVSKPRVHARKALPAANHLAAAINSPPPQGRDPGRQHARWLLPPPQTSEWETKQSGQRTVQENSANVSAEIVTLVQQSGTRVCSRRGGRGGRGMAGACWA